MNWSENGKISILFILFVAQILGCYLGNVCKSKLNNKFSSIPDVFGKMHPILYIVQIPVKQQIHSALTACQSA
jgi:hypothetical protein